MGAYALDIQIDDEGLQAISNANMSVALLEPQCDLDYQIVTLLIPARNTLQIGWTDTLMVYSSGYALQPHTVLHINSHATALPGQIFDFNGSTLDKSGAKGLPGAVQLANSSQDTITGGLAKVFSVNGTKTEPAILGAIRILHNGLGSFEPAHSIMLTLLSGTQGGMVIPSQVIPGYSTSMPLAQGSRHIAAQPPLILDFTPGNATQTAHFDTVNNIFVAGSLPPTTAVSR